MLNWRVFYFTSLDLLIKILIKSKVIFNITENINNLNTQQLLMYAIPYNSKIDLLIIRTQCLKYGLPDPFIPLHINGFTTLRYVFIDDEDNILKWMHNKKLKSISISYNLLRLHHLNPILDIKIIPVCIMFGRFPGKEYIFNKQSKKKYVFKKIKKFFKILSFGHDIFIYFSQPISLNYIVIKYNNDKFIIQKLIRLARIYFIRQQRIASGPKLLIRKNIFNKILTSRAIKKAIENEIRNKKISIKKVKHKIIKIIKEISSSFSYTAICLSDCILRCIWNIIYQELHVYNVDRVYKVAIKNHEIIYIPCHRSHMDYILLSYIIYHQGLSLPHIAAGSNLNFWPIGSIFRHLGAFFIRRTFKGNKLYSTIFREYLEELFNKGYSVEYFIEGKRSRTGRLLKPKTGMLNMTIQAILRGNSKPITLIPIYISYEHIIEELTYSKELHGAIKKKENIWQIILGLYKIRNLGKGYINFGNPLYLTTWLSKQIMYLHNSIDSIEINYRNRITIITDKIADKIMERINNAAVVNAINLCSSIVLSSKDYSITRIKLLSQISCYLNLLRNVLYTSDIIIPNLKPKYLLAHALKMNKFKVKSDNIIGDVIFLSNEQAISMIYYKNNIQHLLVLPSLIAKIICANYGIEKKKLYKDINLFYPLLKAELFMCYSEQEIPQVIDKLLTELIKQELIVIHETLLYPIQKNIYKIDLLASNINETLQRYIIIFSLFNNQPNINRLSLEKKSIIIAQQLSVIHNINISEFFDKSVFEIIIKKLRLEKYINNGNVSIHKKISKIYKVLNQLVKKNILISIKNIFSDDKFKI